MAEATAKKDKKDKKEKKGKGREAAQTAVPAGYTPRMKMRYAEEIVPQLMKELGYKNPLQVPRLSKIVVNIGVGEAAQEAKALDGALTDLATITGQKAIVRKARKSVAGFKIRANMPVGAKVTLRGARMYEFLDRLLSTALPRTRDFRGLPRRSFDGRGNYTLGIDEQLIFPEIDYDKIDRVRGMDVTVVTTAKTNDEGYALLKSLGFPFRER